MNLKERILYYAKSQGISQEDFVESIGVTMGPFRGEAKKKSLRSDVIETLLSKYNISPDWLFFEKGEMNRKDYSRQYIDDADLVNDIRKRKDFFLSYKPFVELLGLFGDYAQNIDMASRLKAIEDKLGISN